MALQKPVTAKEMLFAYNFLKRLGANLNNPYLYTAVVAWLRVGAGYNMTKMVGRNPLMMRIGGKLARFSSLTAAAYAAADAIRHAQAGSAGGYDIIAKVVRRSASGDDNAQIQAHDFLEAVALSRWDAKHYGTGYFSRQYGEYIDPTAASYVESRNTIAAIWYNIHGTLPKITIGTTPAKAQQPAAPVTPQLPPSTARPHYIDPHEAEAFYAASRPPSDLGNLPVV